MRRARFALLFLVPIAAYLAWWGIGSLRVGTLLRLPIPFRRLARPFGMAPPAFAAYMEACERARINPNRIGQTIGNDSRSKGYHRQDGIWHGEPYCAAVDLGVRDLSPTKRSELLESLAQKGFIAWYRSGPRWRFDEHVHAVYAGLPMKPQLRDQVQLWNLEREGSGRKSLWWQRKWRRFWR